LSTIKPESVSFQSHFDLIPTAYASLPIMPSDLPFPAAAAPCGLAWAYVSLGLGDLQVEQKALA
jgi:hypothetical protein